MLNCSLDRIHPLPQPSLSVKLFTVSCFDHFPYPSLTKAPMFASWWVCSQS